MSALRRIASLLLVCCGCANAPPAPKSAAQQQVHPFDGLVDIGGRSLHVHCVGEGAPLVVLDAGYGNDGSIWKLVQADVARTARTCAYDRFGLGYSSPAPEKHTLRQMAGELHALLEQIAPDVPRVLVGHSMAGLIVRLYASEHPSEVSGLVLVDATSEEPIAGQMQATLPRLSSNHVHVVTANSGHFIHIDEPKLVVAAIREVLRASRTRTPVERQRVLAGLP